MEGHVRGGRFLDNFEKNQMLEAGLERRVEWGGRVGKVVLKIERAGVFEERVERAGQLVGRVERASMCERQLERGVVDAVRSVRFAKRREWAEWASGDVEGDERMMTDTKRG